MDGPCLNYQIDLCPAPCSGNINKGLPKNVDKVKLFLEGRHNEVLELLRKRWNKLLRIMIMKGCCHQGSTVLLMKLWKNEDGIQQKPDQDVISYAVNDDVVVVVVLELDSGKIMGKEDFLMEGAQDNYPQEIIGAFIKQYYSGPRPVPAEILLPIKIQDEKLITQWLSEK